MADLVTVDEFMRFLEVESYDDDDVLEALLDELEEIFEASCGREHRPFQSAVTGRLELLDGTGTDTLFVDYPIASVTAIAIGQDPAAPLETLAPADATIVSWRVGRTKIRRIDGGTWSYAGLPAAVRITYDTLDDLPKSAALAIKRVAAAVYRQRGAEDVSGERTSSFSRELITDATADPLWQIAVARSRQVHV